jgi:sialate O-acetylesterase
MNKRASLLVLCLLGAAQVCRAELALSSHLGSGMVVQRDVPIALRGTAAPGGEVRVRQGETRVITRADRGGRWSAELPAPEPGPVADIFIESGQRIVLTDLLAGDVWLASGQSNMEFRLRRSAAAEEEIPRAAHDGIRLFKVGRQIASEPADEVRGEWQRCTPETAAEFSAVAYYFAREVHRETGVPIGILSASWGGTPGEAWAAPAVTRDDPAYAALYAEWEDYRRNWTEIKKRHDAEMAAYEKRLAEPREPGRKPPARPLSRPHPDENPKYPGVLFNGMIHPLVGLPLKGVLWYQGESNTKRSGQYEALLTSLITDWRSRWGRPELPFIIVSLANFKAPALGPGDSGRVRVREAQANVARDLSAGGLVVTIDLGEADDIHPRNKEDVGRRAALAALDKFYQTGAVGAGPSVRRVHFASARAEVEFDGVGGGLQIGRDGRGGKLEGFALAGKDRVWHWAEAHLGENRVAVQSDEVPEPVALRYAWADNPPAGLYNREGLPAVPFRTDNWPLTEEGDASD